VYLLLLGGGLDGGQSVVTTGHFTRGAVGAIVAKVALAALDFAGIPKVVLMTVVLVGVGGAGDHVGGEEAGRVCCSACPAWITSAIANCRCSVSVKACNCPHGARAWVRVGLGVTGKVLVLETGAVAAVVEITREFLDVFAGTVARAALGASGTTAAFSFVAIKAFAFARLAVADALVATFGVVVSLVGAIGSISPSEGRGASAFGAVGSLPVLVAGALGLGTADAVARAGVGARGSHGGEGGEEEGSELHLELCVVVK